MASVLLGLSLAVVTFPFCGFYHVLMIRVEAILVFVWIGVFKLSNRHCVGGVVSVVFLLVDSSK